MAANVESNSTFSTWRTRTNELLQYTQNAGGSDVIKISNNTNSTSSATGALIVEGGAGIIKSITVGENIVVDGNVTVNNTFTTTNMVANGGTVTLGGSSSDNVIIDGILIANNTVSINANVNVDSDDTFSLANSVNRLASIYVSGLVGSNTDGAIQIPSGNTTLRPTSAELGQLRFNTETKIAEVYDGSVWIASRVGSALLDLDGDTKITVANNSTSDNDQIRFYTGNSSTQSTERMNIQGDNVAIGTGSTAGDAMLKIDGTINATGNSVFTGETHLVKANTTFTNRVNITGTIADQLTIAANTTITSANLFLDGTKLDVNAPATFYDSVIVEGDLQVYGTTSTVSATNLQVEDNLIYLNSGNTQWNTTQTSGTGSPDVQFYDQYKVYGSTTYLVEITDATSSPNKFKWSDDNGSTYDDNGGAGYDVSTTGITLSDGIKVVFDVTTGYTLADEFSATVSSTNIDIGFGGNYNNGTYAHAGLFRDATDGVFKFFDNYTPELDATADINTAHASFRIANLEVEDLKSNTITLGTVTIPTPPTYSGQYLAANGNWQVPYTTANSSTLGLVKTGYTTNASSRSYAVELSSEQMFVNIPWTDTTYSVGTGLSMTGTTISFDTGYTVPNATSASSASSATNATNASKIATVAVATNASHYLSFVDSNNGTAANESLYTDGSLYYNPSTNLLTTAGLSVTGTGTITTLNSTTGTITTLNSTTGTIATLSATSITETSSIRYKENVQSINNALDVVLNMRGVSYDRKDSPPETKNQFGVIAEEIDNIVPELVMKNDQGQPDSVQYTKIIPFLIEAIKQQQELINKHIASKE